MIRLALCDLSRHRRSLLAELPILAVIAAVFMSMKEDFGMPPVLIVIGAWSYALQAAYEDDKSEMWVFLRALPIPPAEVVGARFISSALVVFLFTLVVASPLLFLATANVSSRCWPIAIGAALGMVMTALFQVMYYRFGYRAASTWFRYVFFVFFIPVLVPWARLKGNALVERTAARLVAAVTWLAAHPAAAAVLGAALILLLYLGAWVYACRAFARKELT